MKDRRSFLTSLTTLGGITLLTDVKSVGSFATTTSSADEPSLTERVKLAMLSMQRAAWEQGTAIQAAVETNDLLLLHLLVTEAILRQTRDGRTCMVESNNSIRWTIPQHSR